MKQWLRDLDTVTQVILAVLSVAFLILLFAAILGKVHAALDPGQAIPPWIVWLGQWIP